MIDIHAHVTADPAAQLARAVAAGVTTTILLSTRVHPETARTLGEVADQFGRLTAVIGGSEATARSYADADAELRTALALHLDTYGMRNVALSATDQALVEAVADAAADPRIVAVGELTPPPGRAELIEPVLRACSDTTQGRPLPVLVHGFAPNTPDDLRTYAQLAGRYPTVPLVIGAFGGLNSMLAVELAIERPNIFLDTSSALQVFVLAAALREIPERCLLGSNTPYGDARAARATVEAASADPAVLERVFDVNARELFALPERR